MSIENNILKIIKKPMLASFVTINSDGKPWARYVIAIGSDDMTIRFSTFINSRKVTAIKKNPEIHLLCGIENPKTDLEYLQIQGKAYLSTDPTEKHAFWNDELLTYFTGPDDPNYGLIVIKPSLIELHSMSSAEIKIWENKH